MAQPGQVIIETPDHHKFAVDSHVHAGSIIETPDHHRYVVGAPAVTILAVDAVSVPVVLGSDSQVEDSKLDSNSQLVEDTQLQDDALLTDPLALNASEGKDDELCGSDDQLLDSPPATLNMYQPRFIAPTTVYAAPTVPVTYVSTVYAAPAVPVTFVPTVYAAPPVNSSVYSPAVLPVEPTQAMYMWNGTEYDSYDAAVEAMTLHLVPKVDAEESNDVEESNAMDAIFTSNEDPIVEVTKPDNATRVRVVKKKKGCC